MPVEIVVFIEDLEGETSEILDVMFRRSDWDTSQHLDYWNDNVRLPYGNHASRAEFRHVTKTI
jgi:hypothetical protein